MPAALDMLDARQAALPIRGAHYRVELLTASLTEVAGPHPLRRAAEPLPPDLSDADLRILAAELFDAMYRADGVGLAAPQAGVPWPIAVVDDRIHPPLLLIDPRIRQRSRARHLVDDACLSLPGVAAPIERPVRLLVQAGDLHRHRFQLCAEGRLAAIIEHEIDHLEGRLFVDRLGGGQLAVATDPVTRTARTMAWLRDGIEPSAGWRLPRCTTD